MFSGQNQFLACLYCVVAALSVDGSVRAQDIATFVVDGDTIKLGGTTWRLWGIDAPESKQSCGDWPAGVRAMAALKQAVQGKTVTCEARAVDRYGRSVGLCRAEGEDIGAVMVKLGMAWAFVRYSVDYVEVEAQARRENLGVHAHGCQPAWEWRRTPSKALPGNLK